MKYAMCAGASCVCVCVCGEDTQGAAQKECLCVKIHRVCPKGVSVCVCSACQ